MKIYEGFLNYLKLERKSNQTIKSYKDSMRIISKYFWNKEFDKVNLTDIKGLKKKDIKEFKYYLDQKGNKAATQRLRLDSLISFISYLMDEEFLTEKFTLINDIKNIKKKIKDSKKEVIELPNKEDVEEIFNAIRKLDGKFKLRRQLMVHLLLMYGLRRQEITDLKINYLDLDQNLLYVLGKGNKGRVLSLLPETKELICYYLEFRETLSYSDSEYLFVSRKGCKMTTSCLSQEFSKIVKELGNTNKKISPHKLRALLATELHENGTSVAVIKEILGHASLNTTMIYLKNHQKGIKEAMENNPFKDINII